MCHSYGSLLEGKGPKMAQEQGFLSRHGFISREHDDHRHHLFFFAHFLTKPHGPPIYFDTALSSRSVVCQGKVCPQASLRPQGRGVAGSFEELGLLKIEVNTLQIGPC